VLLTGPDLRRDAVAAVVERLAARGRAELDASEPEVRASYDLRYAGQAFELTVAGDPDPEPGDLRAAFDEAHRERYGFSDDDAELELVTVRVAVASPGADPQPAEPPEPGETRGRRARFGGELHDARVVQGVPRALDGPAIVELPGSTLVIPPGWRAEAASAGTLIVERA
jgi:N-methylhydantoinase A/oxoprolinase/acetone carboxylase beta subunit